MRNRRRLVQGTMLLAGVALTVLAPRRALAQFGGEPFSTAGPNCEGLKLQAATGVLNMNSVVGTKHTYHFLGTCFDGARPSRRRPLWSGTGRASASRKISGSSGPSSIQPANPIAARCRVCSSATKIRWCCRRRPATGSPTTMRRVRSSPQRRRQQRWLISCGSRARRVTETSLEENVP